MSTFKVQLKTVFYSVPKDELSQHVGMRVGGELVLDLCIFLQKAALLLLSVPQIPTTFLRIHLQLSFIPQSITLYLGS